MRFFNTLILFLCCFLQTRAQQLYHLSQISGNPNFDVKFRNGTLIGINSFTIRFFDLQNQLSPQAIQSIVPPSWPFSLYTNGNTMYSGGAMMGGFGVYDISDPFTAHLIKFEASIPSTIYQMCQQGNYLYADGNQDTLYVIDITTPASASVINRIAINSTFSSGTLVVGNTLFLGTTSGILIYSLQNPAMPVYQSTVAGNYGILQYNGLDQLLYAANSSGFDVYEVNTGTLTYKYGVSVGSATILPLANEGRRVAFLTNSGVELYDVGATSYLHLSGYSTQGAPAQHNAIALSDSLIAYSTVNDIHLLKYGFSNPAGIEENTTAPSIKLVFNSTRHTISVIRNHQEMSGIVAYRINDITGRLIFEGSEERLINQSFTSEVAPLFFKALLKNGKTINGKVFVETVY